ncbi:MAG: hypothetical protein WB615_09485 [Candidatus Tumulicola sp.]
MRSRIKRSGAALGLAVALTGGLGSAAVPSVADLDASARAAGNRIDVATRIGENVFGSTWPAQVSQISANEIGGHLIVGIRLWGVKFHAALTREEFVGEVAALVERAFAAAPAAEEVDVWTSVPIDVAKGVVVSGDLAKPTSRTVFSLTARRGESAEQLSARAERTTAGDVFWDEEWARAAFKKDGTN